MPRPRKRRFVDFDHGGGGRHFKHVCEMGTFSPSPPEPVEDVQLTIDELEAMRLRYLEKLNQIEGAARMEIHQSTFQRTLKKALEKITDALVHGKTIRIEGGDYRMPGGDGKGPYGEGPIGGQGRGQGGRGQGRGQGGRGQGRGQGFGFGGPEGMCVCPGCGHEAPHQAGVPCAQMKCEKCGTLMVRKT